MLSSFSRKIAPEPVLIAGFSLFTLLGILTHEMWRDELTAWTLARDSTSVAHLLWNARFEGHPTLWHFCLYVTAQFTHNPLGMQLFHWSISVGTVYLLIKHSPFCLFHRFLLSFGYYFFYEYAIISRSYGLSVFLSFLFCCLYRKDNTKYVSLSFVLALMANVSAYAFIISMMLAFFLFLERPKKLAIALKIGWLRLVASATVLCVGWLFSAWQIVRVKVPVLRFTEMYLFKEESMVRSSLPGIFTVSEAFFRPVAWALQVPHMFTNIWLSYVPVPPIFQRPFWNRNILTSVDYFPDFQAFYSEKLIAFFLSIAIFSLAVYLFFVVPNVLCTYIFGTFGILLFQITIHTTPSLRHRGHLFIVFILCAWLCLKERPKISYKVGTPVAITDSGLNARRRSWFNLFLSVLLSVQMLAGVYCVGMDYLYPFSPEKAAATFIQTQELTTLPIVSDQDRLTIALNGYLNVPIDAADRYTLNSKWANTPGLSTAEQLLLQTAEAYMNLATNHTVLLALTYPLPPAEEFTQYGLISKRLASFTQPSIAESPAIYLYQLFGASSTTPTDSTNSASLSAPRL